MKVTKNMTAFQMADKLCKFIPELEPSEVVHCLTQFYGYYADASSFHDWVQFFDSLVIDRKEISYDDVFSRFSAEP